MAEQKIEETKPAVPRRVARPFIGPAGAGSGVRAPLRPAAPTDRPRPAAFAPSLPHRPALGAPSGSVNPAATPPVAAIPLPTIAAEAAVAEIASESAPTLADTPMPDGQIVESVEAAVTTPLVGEPVRPVTSEMVAIDAMDAFEAVWSSPELTEAPTIAEAPGATGAPAIAEPASAPMDDLSLGGGLDGPHLWTDEITAEPEHAVQPDAIVENVESQSFDRPWAERETAPVDIAMPAWLADDAEPVTDTASVDARLSNLSWPEAYTTPSDAPANDLAAESPEPDESLWPDPLLAEYAPYIPTPSSVGAIPTPASLRAIEAAAEDQTTPVPVAEPAAAELTPASLGSSTDAEAVESLVEYVSPEVAPAAPVSVEFHAVLTDAEDTVASEVSVAQDASNVAESTAQEPREPVAQRRVSAALDRLAERVRSGEIDVSSVAAEAPDAALLASLLAALLGGSNSR